MPYLIRRHPTNDLSENGYSYHVYDKNADTRLPAASKASFGTLEGARQHIALLEARNAEMKAERKRRKARLIK